MNIVGVYIILLCINCQSTVRLSVSTASPENTTTGFKEGNAYDYFTICSHTPESGQISLRFSEQQLPELTSDKTPASIRRDKDRNRNLKLKL